MDRTLQQYRRKMSQGEGSVEEYLNLISRSGFQIGANLSERHRKIAWMHLLHPGSADFSEIGSGKRIPAIEAIRVMIETGLVKDCLIVTPASMMECWTRLLQEHAPGLQVTVLRGSNEYKKKLLESASDTQVYIASYGGMIRKSLGEELVQRNWGVVVADESHRANNPKTQRSQYLYRLADKTKYRIALTGCLFVKPEGIWGIFRFINSSFFGTIYRTFLTEYFQPVEDNKPWTTWRLSETIASRERLRSSLRSLPGITWH